MLRATHTCKADRFRTGNLMLNDYPPLNLSLGCDVMMPKRPRRHVHVVEIAQVEVYVSQGLS